MNRYITVDVDLDLYDYVDDILDSLDDKDVLDEALERGLFPIDASMFEKAAFFWNTGQREEFLELARDIVQKGSGLILK